MSNNWYQLHGGQQCFPLEKKNKERFDPNLFVKKFYPPVEDRWITLKVSGAGLRMINKVGIEAALRGAVEKGHIKNY